MRIANENRTGNVSENGNGERKSLNVDACVCIWIYACGLYIGRVIILIFVYCLLTLCLRHSSCGYWHGINNHMQTEPRPTNRPYAIYSTLYSRCVCPQAYTNHTCPTGDQFKVFAHTHRHGPQNRFCVCWLLFYFFRPRALFGYVSDASIFVFFILISPLTRLFRWLLLWKICLH